MIIKVCTPDEWPNFLFETEVLPPVGACLYDLRYKAWRVTRVTGALERPAHGGLPVMGYGVDVEEAD